MYEELLMFCENVLKNRAVVSIRPSEVRLLMLLGNAGGVCNPATMAQVLGVSKPMITASLANLIKLGLVAKVPSPEDGRSVLVLPTKKGGQLLNEIKQKNQNFMDDLAEKIGRKKFESFIKTIVDLNNLMKK